MPDHLAVLQGNQRGDDKTICLKTCNQIGFVILAECRAMESHDGGTMRRVFFDIVIMGRV